MAAKAPIEPGTQPVRLGQAFTVPEAAKLLRDGVLIPDYPMDQVAEAWRYNYEWALKGKPA
jgi:hypothetical protein